jgi:hypothetical protein
MQKLISRHLPAERRAMEPASSRAGDQVWDRCDGLKGSQLWVVFAMAVVLTFSRAPHLLLNAQFFAEDGQVWFAQAYNLGWLRSLLIPQAGYLNSMPRLAAGVALLVPMRWAPLAMAMVGLLVEALPVPILLSSRLCTWAPLATRCVMAAIYIALPNTSEIRIVATNTQWHLSLVLVLLALARSPKTWLDRCLDVAATLVAAFSGPFCAVLVPIALLFWWKRRRRWTLVIFWLVTMAACIQIAIVSHQPARLHRPLGANIDLLVRMIGGNVVGEALLGTFAFSSVLPVIFLGMAAILCVSLVAYCFGHAHLEWKLFLAYCWAIFAASLLNPLVEGNATTSWELLLTDFAARYWFLPMLAFVWSAAWCATDARSGLFRKIAIGTMVCLPLGVIHDWHCPSIADDHSAVFLDRMQNAKPGEHVVFPIEPEGWQIELVKKPSP